MVDGISSFFAALLVLVPFFMHAMFPNIQMVYYIALGASLVTLFGLGLFLGNISKENLILSGIKTVVARLTSIVIASLLNTSPHKAIPHPL